ncbi:MAG TPA: DUF3500 domain-containing protein [Planctomycetota bacterium]|nr:DUF3500 domain-containing protein [Planctomycetota bacterium]
MKALGSRLLLVGVLALSFALAAASEAARSDEAAAVMAKAASAFLDGLDESQRAKASFAFNSPVRLDWHFVPRERQGLAIGELSEKSRKELDALIDSGLSSTGHRKFKDVLELEGVLREREGPGRDPGKYHVAIFGKPGTDPWGWRFEGHHWTAHFTSVDKEVIAVTPSFVGANPSNWSRCDNECWSFIRPLAAEEERASALVTCLRFEPEMLERARLRGKLPQDVLLDPSKSRLTGEPAGVRASDLTPKKRELLLAIVDGYFADLSADLAARERARFAQHPLDKLYFAWAGENAGLGPWYWRVQGDYFAIEFVYPRGEVNHAHRIWRDFERDLGGDALREHLAGEKK